jgi:hypothetical protein
MLLFFLCRDARYISSIEELFTKRDWFIFSKLLFVSETSYTQQYNHPKKMLLQSLKKNSQHKNVD